VAILSIINLLLAVILRNPDLEQIITTIDVFLIAVFLIDVLRRLRVATDDRAYIVHGSGWLDPVSVIPLLRISRLLRIVRVSRLVGRMGGPKPCQAVLQGSDGGRAFPGPAHRPRGHGVWQPRHALGRENRP
jgi:hypothetical protein